MGRIIALAITLAFACGCATAGRDGPATIEKIVPMGPLILRCPFPGETRADNVSPKVAIAWQVSKDRWFLLYHTRGYTKADDERSVLYQVRENAPDGKVLKEAMLQPSNEGGAPNDERGATARPFKAHGHAMVWGVPKGALIGGKPAPNANLFCAKWYTSAGPVRTQWVQFKLNDAGNDIEILQPVAPIDCGHQPLAKPIALNPECTEWADVCGTRGGIQAVKYVFDAATGRYKLGEKGPVCKTDGSEASLVKINPAQWLFSFRRKATGADWAKASDPFAAISDPVHTEAPNCGSCQSQSYMCADGVVRRFYNPGGNRAILHCADIDPVTLAPSNERVVFDSKTVKPFTDADGRVVISFLLCPHGGGTEQYIMYCFRPKALDVKYGSMAPVSSDSKDSSGVYYSKIVYTKPLPGMWNFGE